MKVYDGKLLIWNEGKLPSEIKVEELKTNHLSIPRNRLLADTFYKAGFIEAWGRGTIKIIEFCKQQGLPEPDFKEHFGGFMIVFYKDIYNEESLKKMGLNERQIKAVMYVKEKGQIGNKEYQNLTGVSKATATRDLNALIKKSILEQFGTTGKGTFYKIKK